MCVTSFFVSQLLPFGIPKSVKPRGLGQRPSKINLISSENGIIIVNRWCLFILERNDHIMKNKHLLFEERMEIEKGLNDNLSFKEIGRRINKDCTTISKEVRNHIIYKNTGAYGHPHFDCVYGTNCPFRDFGIKCTPELCENYQKHNCEKLQKPPYVCNGCKDKNTCRLSKQFYQSEYAHKEYKENLSEVREGINFSEQELNNLNEILEPLIKDQGQSIHHAVINNKNTIMCSEKEIYKLIDMGVLAVRNIDLPRKVRLRNTPKRKSYYKIDKQCLQGRKYADYLKFIEENPDINVVEMDSVEGIKGGKVLLTIHFVNCSFMLAFIRDKNDAQSVIDIFNKIEELFGIEAFKELFPIILTDNGSEFSNPKEIEFSPYTGEKRTQIFYCEPSRSDQKGSCEVNHEMIRRILPKGTSFDNLTQNDVNKIMSHINSYKRKKLNNQSPVDMFNLLYGTKYSEKLGIKIISGNDINLTPNLINQA